MHRLTCSIALMLAACGSDWPEGAERSVEERWCRGSCVDVALLTKELAERNASQSWYLLVWAQLEDSWLVGYFWGPVSREDPDGSFTDYFIADGPPTYRVYTGVPSFEEVEAQRTRWVSDRDLVCYQVLNDNWLAVTGSAVDDGDEDPCD